MLLMTSIYTAAVVVAPHLTAFLIDNAALVAVVAAVVGCDGSAT